VLTCTYPGPPTRQIRPASTPSTPIQFETVACELSSHVAPSSCERAIDDEL
jgi:hypothetical protein